METSPDMDSYSTPPSSPAAAIVERNIAPSLDRRLTRPSHLKIAHTPSEWNQDVVLEANSPDSTTMSGPTPVQTAPKVRLPTTDIDLASVSRGISPGGLTPQTATPAHRKIQADYMAPMKSPCFVHSHLDKGASLADWLRTRQPNARLSQSQSTPQPPGSQLEPDPQSRMDGGSISSSGSSVVSSPSGYGDDEEEEEFSSLTKQLAETAAGVREMSKQLGRTRVRSNIQNVLVITKARDNRLIKLTRDLALYLMSKQGQDGRGIVVYVDRQLRTSKRFDAAGIERDHPEFFIPQPRRRSSSSNSLASMTSNNHKDEANYQAGEGQLRYWTSEMCSKSPHLFDFVVTLGGDGTVLFTSWLFQSIVPPVLSFALGSLGFLTNFDFADHKGVMDSAIDAGIRVNLRMRFTCTIYRAVAPQDGKGRQAIKKGATGEILMKNIEKGGWEALEGGWSGLNIDDDSTGKDKEIMCFTTRPVEQFEVLNDLVVDRGPSPYVSLLELFGDEHHMTTVQADGLVVATPTGSTAYSLSAGGSLAHPEIPAILISPICPHTLSFRPMLLPDSMELRICVPFNSRSTAWASFDGRGRVELKQGDHIKVTASQYPFPTVCADKQSTDWFHAISRTLKWNERERQKSFVVVEEGPARQKNKKAGKTTSADTTPVRLTVKEDEEEDEVEEAEAEEEKFDIDDSSPEANAVAEETAQAKAAKEVATQHPSPRLQTARQAAEALIPPSSRVPHGPHHDHGSGIDSPDRFAGGANAYPHPPPRAQHTHHPLVQHVSSADPSPPSSGEEYQGARDDLHSGEGHLSGRSRIPKDRDVEAESMNMKTPTIPHNAPAGSKHPHQQPVTHQRSRSKDQRHGHRAFAVWGHDASDSNASDSDDLS